MPDIDYNALAYSSGLTVLMRHDFGPGTVTDVNIARAVVAALRDQGFDITPHVHRYVLESLPPMCVCGATALAAPDDGE